MTWLETLLIIAVVVLIMTIISILYILWDWIKATKLKHLIELKEKDKKYEDYTLEVNERNNNLQHQFNGYEGVIESLWVTIEKQEAEIVIIEKAKKYAQRKVTKHEITISTLTGNKTILRWRKFKTTPNK